MSYLYHRASKGTPKQLAQVTAGVAAASIYSPPANVETEITAIIIANVSNASNRWFSIWIDDDGSTYQDGQKLFHEINVEKKTTTIIDVPIFMNNTAGNLAVAAQNATDITITVYGIEYDIS